MRLLTLKHTSSPRNPVQIQMAVSLPNYHNFYLDKLVQLLLWLLQGNSSLLTALAPCYYYAGVILMSQCKEGDCDCELL